MKSLLSILMSVLILTSNLGWIQTTHYCLGRPVESNLGLEVAHLSCGMVMTSGCSEEMEQKPGCCHNEMDKLSLDQHILAQGLDFISQVFLVALPPINLSGIVQRNYTHKTEPVRFVFEDPPPKNTPLFIAYQMWLI